MKHIVFSNRVHAGQLLAEALVKYADRDDLVALMTPDFRSVGQWYEDFSQTTDAEVTPLLAKATRLERAPTFCP